MVIIMLPIIELSTIMGMAMHMVIIKVNIKDMANPIRPMSTTLRDVRDIMKFKIRVAENTRVKTGMIEMIMTKEAEKEIGEI